MTAIAAAIALVFALATPIAAPAGPPADCRCAQLTLDRYYADASIVVVARVTAVRPVERDNNAAATAGADSTAPAPVASPDRGRTAGYIEIDIQPLFRQGRAFKGSLDGVTFVTSDNSASCGVPVEAGATYIIFGVPDPADPTVAYFDTCSGSRQYPDAQHRDITVDYVGTPDNRVVPRLFELADAGAASQQSQSPVPDFHTSPACWDGPRIMHTGTPASDLREGIRLRTERISPPDTGGIVSPNRGYTAFAQWTPPDASNESRAVVFIDVERSYILRLDVAGPRGTPQIDWISEKLLFVRIAWGRIVFTDLIVDVEQSHIIYEEAATDGQIAFQQYAQACIGQCPCFVVPGSADSLPEPPRHTPTPDDANAIEILALRPMAFLDADWDGRVFTEPAGLRFTVSGLWTDEQPREVPLDVLEVRTIDGFHWLHIAIYAESTCVNADATPLHAGWVPAFSVTGRFVLGTWPAGCSP